VLEPRVESAARSDWRPAEPDQVERAAKLEDGEQLSAGKDDCRDADGSSDDVNDTAESSTRRRCEASAASAGDRPGRDVEDTRAGEGSKDQRCGQE